MESKTELTFLEKHKIHLTYEYKRIKYNLNNRFNSMRNLKQWRDVFIIMTVGLVIINWFYNINRIAIMVTMSATAIFHYLKTYTSMNWFDYYEKQQTKEIREKVKNEETIINNDKTKNSMRLNNEK